MTRKSVLHQAEAFLVLLKTCLTFRWNAVMRCRFPRGEKNLASFRMRAETKCKIHVVYLLYMIISCLLQKGEPVDKFFCTTTIKKSFRAGILHVNIVRATLAPHVSCTFLTCKRSKAKYPNFGLKRRHFCLKENKVLLWRRYCRSCQHPYCDVFLDRP